MVVDDDDADRIVGDRSSGAGHARGKSFGVAGTHLWKRLARTGVPLQWQCFLGSCLLTGAALLPHTRVRPVLGGMALAAFIRYAWSRLTSRRRRAN
jgi:hypothetical protein